MEDLTRKIREFLGDGYGYGSGDGYGDGYGSGDGDGYGYGYGDGYGSGDGYGDGYGYGYGYGDGYGYGLKEFNGQTVYLVDGVETLIDHVHGSFAKGRIIKSDLTTEVCFIAKQDGRFAHGETLKEARAAVLAKMFDDMPEEDRISAFMEAYPDPKQAVDNLELFDWHHRLTGSCEMGRKAFVADRGLTLDGETTVAEFISLTENAYGGETIRKLKEAYKLDDR